MYGLGKPLYGLGKPVYGPPKPVHELVKPLYGLVKLLYRPAKPVYGPGKPLYGQCKHVWSPFHDLPTFLIFQISYTCFKILFRDFGVLFLLLRGRETLASTKLDSSRRVIYDSFRRIFLRSLYKTPIDHFIFLATRSPKLNVQTFI